MEPTQYDMSKLNSTEAKKCIFIMSKGIRKNQPCGKKVITDDNFCGEHRRVISKRTEIIKKITIRGIPQQQ